MPKGLYRFHLQQFTKAYLWEYAILYRANNVNTQPANEFEIRTKTVI